MRTCPSILTIPLVSGCVAAEPALPALEAPRVIAVIAQPAEARPGDSVRYEAVVALPDPSASPPRIRWSYCSDARPLGENGPVAEACARAPTGQSIHTGSVLSAVVPKDACARFGSEAPAGLRPADADLTGGDYQPLRLALDGGSVAVFRQRIRCALANAPVADAQRYAAEYADNQAPAIARLVAWVDGGEQSFDALPASTDAELRLEAAPHARERYLRYDPTQARLVEQREHLHVRWWAAHGQLDVAESELVNGVASVRISAGDGAPIQVWAVLSDDRGAASVARASFGSAL
jgi:hypothetical protein